jgi:hypothetical protein
MKEDTRWIVIAGMGLLTLSLIMYTAHYLIFQDAPTCGFSLWETSRSSL